MNKNYCIGCGKEIDKRSKRCNSCANKGKNNKSYKDGRTLKKNYCLDCGKEIKWCSKKCNICKNKGRKASIKTRNKLSKIHSGENHHNWNSELTDEDRQDRRFIPEYTKWRNDVFEKANYTCEVCGKHGGNLEAHHKNSYTSNPDQRTLLENGVCLCEICHKNFHHQYGYGDNTEEQFLEFKEKYIVCRNK